ncbi:MerR family transcriptional regulator [Christensenellaceae bacterium OttesenSCG-928-M15]|nr:MerR family transcriptional regulator [Christensenellaceae bacterium OttesenSCG-928-M15]
MRIGEVSKRYGIPINNLYFYINYGLIVPPRPGGQYVFDEKTLADIQLLLELKEMEFPLKTIHRILSLFRVSQLEDQQDIDDLRYLYLQQLEVLKEKGDRLEKSMDTLRAKISSLEARLEAPSRQGGVPLSMLHMLCCPQCGGGLSLSDVEMNQLHIYSGKLACACGYRAVIQDGIFCTPNRNTSLHDKPEVTRSLYKDLPPPLISLFQSSYNRMTEHLRAIGTKNKVILESYINAWFFLHNHQHILERGCKLIILDKFPETLLYFKNLIDRQNRNFDILYIADSGVAPPLQKGIVDINVDFFAFNEHNFYHHTFWADHLRPYLKDGAYAVGTYFYFENGYRSMRRLMKEYPESYHENFHKEYFLKSMEKNFHMLEMEDAGYTTESGENLGFSFHVAGEKMFLLPYLAGMKGHVEKSRDCLPAQW